jgi:hypothetical protein
LSETPLIPEQDGDRDQRQSKSHEPDTRRPRMVFVPRSQRQHDRRRGHRDRGSSWAVVVLFGTDTKIIEGGSLKRDPAHEGLH